jgi:hypothetical protein
MDGELIETRLEERDGATWVSGLCPKCRDRVTAKESPTGVVSPVRCSNGHELRVGPTRSAGVASPVAGH